MNDKNESLFPQEEKEEFALHPGWLEHEDLLIHLKLFEESGLLAVTTPNDPELLESVKDNYFILGNQRFELKNRSDLDKKRQKEIKKAETLLSSLSLAAVEKDNETAPKITNHSSRVICNPKRRAEVYFPHILEENKTDHSSPSLMHIYPWLSQNTSEQTHFSGFTQYVTACCLIGSNLQAQDQFAASWPFIKHDHLFHRDQIITSMYYNSTEANAFEEAVFYELEKSIQFMKQHAKPQQDIACLLHLPTYDYMLFGIGLFLEGRIELKALDQLISVMENIKIKYTPRIKKAFATADIQVEITSPFAELFAPLKNKRLTALNVLTLLDISPNKKNSSHENDQSALEEQIEKILTRRNLVYRRLKKLTLNGEYKQIWQDFWLASGYENLKTLEDLFKLANGYMIARAAFNKEDYSTCSLLPTTEKQIQLCYAHLTSKCAEKHKEKKEKNPYSIVVNITSIDSILAYSLISLGRIFYFPHCRKSLSDLIKNQDVMKTANSNAICSFFGGRKNNTLEPAQPISLKQVLYK